MNMSKNLSDYLKIYKVIGDEEIKISKGDIAIFPSNFLYPHQVLPVTSGVRYSFVSWA